MKAKKGLLKKFLSEKIKTKKNWVKKFFKKITKRKKRKSFWKFFSFKKRKKKQNKKIICNLAYFAIFAVGIVFIFQLALLFKTSIYLESFQSKQKIQFELSNLEQFVLETENDFKSYFKDAKWSIIENKKAMAEKIRHLNYLNVHLQKTIDQYNQDWSLKVFSENKKEIDQIFNQVQSSQLISSRIANKIDTLLLFEEINQKQIELVEKDLELFYEKNKSVAGN